jgi:hypothetical protein
MSLQRGNKREAIRLEKYIEVKEAIESEGYKIHTDAYINNMTMFDVTCNQGHHYETNWNRFQNGKRCRRCFELRVIKTANDINEELLTHGCELIGEYYGSEKPFKYKCVCGNPSKIRIGDFRRGVRCSRCAGDKIKEFNRNKRKQLIENFNQRINQ